jgi:catechol 2,3-dioxygenase-like lactoylglutathione lyase family enzyme
MEFSQAVLTVRKFGECFVFYKDLLGLELASGGERGPVAAFQSGGAKFTILDARAVPAEAAALLNGVQGAPRVTLAFRASDVDAEFERLSAAGVRYAVKPHDFVEWHVRSSICLDPDGNPVEIVSPLTGKTS